MKDILVTGGLGFIGSHTCVELVKANYNPIVIDNLDNSEPWIKDRIEQLTKQPLIFYKGDCADKDILKTIFTNHKIEGVIHFAANKAVGESVLMPLKYYANNINSLISILEVSQSFGCNNLVFSSSCTVYGSPNSLPVKENEEIKKADSPYGSTKIYCENIIADFIKAKPGYKSVLLRYFNPIGAHQSSLLGELPKGIPGNLVPFITQTAVGLREKLTVFGNDYNTEDGSCIRDYIHVVDLANAHIKALGYLDNKSESICEPINIGTGIGYSVLQLIKTFEKSTGVKLNYVIGARRAGDVEAVYADATSSKEKLGWEPQLTLDQSLLDAWNWQVTLK